MPRQPTRDQYGWMRQIREGVYIKTEPGLSWKFFPVTH
jgi:hypothetical protein